MRISNVELRKQMFGAPTAREEPARAKAQTFTKDQATRQSMAPRAQGRTAALAEWASRDDTIQPDPPALAGRMMSRALASLRADPPGRWAFADAGKGAAVLLVILGALIATAGQMPAGFGWFEDIRRFLQPFAVPSLLLFAGMFMRHSRDASWSVYLPRKIWPLAAAFGGWVAGALVLTLLFASDSAAPGFRIVTDAIRAHVGLGVVLMVLPLFLFVWKLLGRFRTGSILVLAAILEILHTEQGGVLWTEAMRGLVYFAAGHCLAPNLRALARFTRQNATSATAILSVWAAFNALLTSADLPLAFGEKISTLPFASLGLGLAGAAAMVMLGEIISGSRFGAVFGMIGRKWIAVYAAVPLAIFGLAQAMTGLDLFHTPSQAIAAILLAALASVLALFVLEMREPALSPQAGNKPAL